MNTSTKNSTFRFFGVGPEWSPSLESELIVHVDQLDCIELIPENFFNDKRSSFLKLLASRNIPVSIHGMNLSIGSDEVLAEKHLMNVLRIADEVNTFLFSEHLAMTKIDNWDVGHLIPLPWTVEAADIVSRKVERIQRITKIPFAFEHIAHRFFFPESELSEQEFINLILERTGCHLVLDLNNLFVNSRNADFDPFLWLSQVHLERTALVHLAGGYKNHRGFFIDGHSHPVPKEVWDLFVDALPKIHPLAIIVERSENYPGFSEIQKELAHAAAMRNTALELEGKS